MWARKRLPLSWTAGLNRPLMTWRHCVPQHLFLCMPTLQSHLSYILMLVALGLGAVLYQTWEDGTKAVIAYASSSLNKAESHYPAHKLEFLALKWAVVEKFHEYLYGSTFHVYTDNNPLTHVLTTAKLDAASHHWVASWQITISGCTIRQVGPTLMQMLYLEYLGLSACLTIWVPV